MMRSMYSGVSGLRVHQTKMDVIGNNIANVNTVGYKKAQASFQEAFSQVIKGGSSPSGGSGGTNPQQIGLGLKLGEIKTIHTKGATQRTDNPTDLMIDGSGFFMLSDDPNAENRMYSRAGNFSFDVAGNLVAPSGHKLLGEYIGDKDYATYLGIDSSKDLSGIKVNKSIPAPSTGSSKVEIRGNLDSRIPAYDPNGDGNPPFNDEGKYTTDAYIKDSLGNYYKMSLRFEKTNNANEWNFTIPEIKDVATGNTVGSGMFTETIEFDGTNGSIIGNASGETSFNIDLDAVASIKDVSFGSSTNNEIALDMSKMTQFGNENSAKGYDIKNDDGQMGRSSGAVTDFTINDSGKVIASFDNGVKMPLWQIKLANFDNPAGLVKSGSNFFDKTPNSGEPQLGNPGNSGLGSIAPGALEMSNVDLSMEFTEMISTQRGFQANSRVITTTDEMLQELTNMKR